MAFYESTIIVRPDITATDLEALNDNLTGIITSSNGKVVKSEMWGLRDLAYKIKKNKKGSYIHYGIEANVDTVNEYKRKISLNEDIMRHLIIKVDAISSQSFIGESKRDK